MTNYLSNIVGHHTEWYHKVIRMLRLIIMSNGWTSAAKWCIYIHKWPF